MFNIDNYIGIYVLCSCGRCFPPSYKVCPQSAWQLSRSKKRRPHVLASISAIPGRILVIFPILKIPIAYSKSLIKLNFLHGGCGKSYSNFYYENYLQTLASNCSINTYQREKALIHHASLYVYFRYIKFLANPCTLRVRDLGF